MKVNAMSARFVAALSVVAAFVLFAPMAQAAPGGSAELTWISKGGVVTYSTGGGAFQPATKGLVLKEGDVLRTDDKTSAKIDLRQNNGVVHLNPSTELVLAKLSVDKNNNRLIFNTLLDLKQGEIVGLVNRMPKDVPNQPNSSYEVKMPRGIAAVRGTVYKGAAVGNFDVALGTVLLTYMTPQGTPQTVTLTGRQRFNIPNQILTQMTQQEQNELLRTVGSGDGTGPGTPPPTTPPVPEGFVSPVVP